MLTERYMDILGVHVTCVAISGLVFAARSVLRINNSPMANHRLLRVTAMVIDSVLLVAAIMLSIVIRQYPFMNAWLTVKLLLLVAYVALGTVALKRARTTRGRVLASVAALATFGTIVSVAVSHQPLGWLAAFR